MKRFFFIAIINFILPLSAQSWTIETSDSTKYSNAKQLSIKNNTLVYDVSIDGEQKTIETHLDDLSLIEREKDSLDLIYSVLINYLYFALYLLLCKFAVALIKHFRNVKKDCYKASEHLRELYDTQYNILAKTPLHSYKLKNNKLNPGRYYYKTWVLSSAFLIVFSSFMLSNFLENFGVLATSLIENPIRINFSHVLASAIVFAQLLTGAGYYIFYNNQKKSKEYIWPLLKVLMMFSLICIAFIEIIIWANLSASFDMTKVLGLGELDVVKNSLNYFLGIFGLGLSIIGFCSGYLISQYRSDSGDSVLLNNIRYVFFTTILVCLLYLPSLLLLALGILFLLIISLIEFIILPGNFIFEKFKRNKSEPMLAINNKVDELKDDVVPEVVDEFEDNKEDQDVDDSYMTDSPEKSDDEDEEDNYNYRDSSD